MSCPSADDRQTLLLVARQTLVLYLDTGAVPDHASDSPALSRPRAAFVTLRRRDTGSLRGCRGECQARRPLIESVVRMSIAAATDDPRFPPVTPDELPAIRIEISALTALRPIRPEEVVLGRHGLMITKGDHLGLLLPQVPVAHDWDRSQFLRGVCRKAGLPEDAWDDEAVRLLAFESEAWEEP